MKQDVSGPLFAGVVRSRPSGSGGGEERREIEPGHLSASSGEVNAAFVSLLRAACSLMIPSVCPDLVCKRVPVTSQADDATVNQIPSTLAPRNP